MNHQKSDLDRKLYLIAYEVDSKLKVAEAGGYDKKNAIHNFLKKFNKNARLNNQPFTKVKIISALEKYNNFCLEM